MIYIINGVTGETLSYCMPDEYDFLLADISVSGELHGSLRSASLSGEQLPVTIIDEGIKIDLLAIFAPQGLEAPVFSLQSTGEISFSLIRESE